MKLKTGKTYYGVSLGGCVLEAMPIEVVNLLGEEKVFYVTLAGEDMDGFLPQYKVESTTPKCFLEYFNHKDRDAANSVASKVSDLNTKLTHLLYSENVVPRKGVPEDPNRIPF